MISLASTVYAFLAKHSVLILIALSVASLAVLFSGGPVLSIQLPGGLPFGNLLSAFPFCLPALAAVELSRKGTTARYISNTSLAIAIGWLPVSLGLAGNLNLNFSGIRGHIWIWLSLATATFVGVALVWAAIDCLRWRYRNEEP